MSTDTASATEHEVPHEHHPSDTDYVQTAIILAVLTALEVSTYYIDFGWATVPLLVVLMTVKFLYVAGIFMHLKFDIGLYRQMVAAGLVLAIALYTIVLLTFFSVPGFFDSFG